MSKTSKIIQIVLLVAIVAAGINFYLTMRERRTGLAVPTKPEVALDPDYYVTPKKLRPQDLKDARQLTLQPAWVREGYRYTFYPYAGHSDYQHPAGTLGPIERLTIKDVVLDRTPGSATQKQVMAVFEKDGKRYAFPSASRKTAAAKSIPTRSCSSRTLMTCTSTGRLTFGSRWRTMR